MLQVSPSLPSAFHLRLEGSTLSFRGYLGQAKVCGLVGRGNVNASGRLYVCHRAYHLFGRHVGHLFCGPSYRLSSRGPCYLDNDPGPGPGLCNDRGPCRRILSWMAFGSYAWSATETESDVKVSPSCLESLENMTCLYEA